MRSSGYVDRRAFICAYAEGKRVLDCGVVGLTCLDDKTRLEGIEDSLHWQVASVASQAVGVDNAAAVVRALRERYPSMALRVASVETLDEDLADEEPFELVILGDLIEHLSNPGRALDAVRSVVHPGGEVLLTCPNAFGAPNYLRFLLGGYREGADHVASYTKYTLGNLLRRHGFELVSVQTALNRWPASPPRRLLYRILSSLLRLFPELGGTLLVVARPTWGDASSSITPSGVHT